MIHKAQHTNDKPSVSLLFKAKDNKLFLVQQNESLQIQGSGANAGEEPHTETHIELPNLITLLKVSPLKDKPWVKTLAQWENLFFSLVPLLLLTIVVVYVYRRRKLLPGRLQTAVEVVVETFDNFVCESMGKENGRHFLPYVGSLFIFILFNNLIGIIPFMKSPTASIRTTIALAICTFFYVQYVAITKMGLFGYLYHLAGTPKGFIMWLVSPLLFPMHIIGEIAKPLSLSVRLFGNIFGKETLIGVLAVLGILGLGFLGIKHPVVGFPLQFFVIPLGILLGIIQAVVFALLSMIYFISVMPEEEH